LPKLPKNIPKEHPRFISLKVRAKLVDGLKKGIVVPHGLLAHGRGEAFDYLLGEHTTDNAFYAEKVACCLLLISKFPVISVNGNTAALCGKEIVELGKLVNASLEVNLFHKSQKRSHLIEKILKENGANQILGLRPTSKFTINEISSNRRFVDENGIAKADTVFLTLEDGDRCQALVGLGKKIISVDLNPLSRTAQASSVTIVDNLIRAIPNMVTLTKELSRKEESELLRIVSEFDNKSNLIYSTHVIRNGI
jgi:4-phosphopantoate---beta-alanine ligase